MASEIDVLLRAQDEATKVIEETDAALEEFGGSVEEVNRALEEGFKQGKSFNEVMEELQQSTSGATGELQKIGATTSEVEGDVLGLQKNLFGVGRGLIGLAAVGGVAFQITRAVKEFVASSLELASAMDAANPKIQAYNKALEETERVSKLLAITTARELAPAMTRWQKLVTDTKTGVSLASLVRELGDAGLEAAGLAVAYQTSLGPALRDTTTDDVIPAAEALERLAEAAGIVVEEFEPMTSSIAAWARVAGDSDRAMLKLAGVLKEDIPKAIDETIDAAEDLSDVFSRADLGIAGSIANILDTIDFLAGGGGELQVMAEMLKAALIDGVTISDEDAKAMFEEIFIEAQVLQVQLGNISAFEAAANIRDQLGGSLDDARATVDAILGGLDLISLKDISIAIAAGGAGISPEVLAGITDDVIAEISGRTEPAVLEEIKGWAASMEEAGKTGIGDPLLTAFQGLADSAKSEVDLILPELDRVEEGIRDWRDRVNEVAEGMGIIFRRADITISFTTSEGTTP